MAILEMQRIFLYGLRSDRKAILEDLHKKEAVEVTSFSEKELPFRYKNTDKSIAQFEKYMAAAESALETLGEYSPEKTGFLSGKHILPVERYRMEDADSDESLKAVYQIIGAADKVRELREKITQISARQTALQPYLPLDVPMNLKESGHVFMELGRLGGLWTKEQLDDKLRDHDLQCTHFEILDASREQTCVWLAAHKRERPAVEELLREIGWKDPPVALSHLTPKVKNERLRREKQEYRKTIEENIAVIKKLASKRRDIQLLYDHLRLRTEKYQVLSKLGMTRYTFVLEGYIPKRRGEEVGRYFEDRYKAYVELMEPEDPDDVPVQFKNNRVVAPVEGITEVYSMPSKGDLDPNPVMAFFYYLFFGMMFSDAGYGLLVAIVCGYLGYGKRLEKPRRKNYRMFFFCGLSTTFWGLMYGSFFGDIVHTVSANFLGKDIALTPIWIDPVSEPLQLLIFSVALGMVQILVGLILKFIVLVRQKKALDAVFDVGFWIVVLVGVCIMAVGMGLSIPVLNNVGIYIMIAGGLGLIVTGGRNNKNIFGKIFGGILSLYDITGYISDVLSYSRLMALGLTTGVIASVVNMLGAMFGPVVFVLIATLGHAINFAINMLGAYVHTNRLQYVEFFSKFYEGGGRKFAPFRMDTKYNQFSEE